MEMKKRVQVGLAVLVTMVLVGMVSEASGQVEPNLVAWWKLDEGSGTTVVDSAGGHDGVMVGDPNWVAGVDNAALEFDSTYDGVHMPHHTDLNPGTGPFTLTGWIRNENTPGSPWKRIITKRGAASTWYSLGLYDNKLILELAENHPSAREVLSAPPEIQGDGVWRHVAGVRDEAGNVCFYINGEQYSAGVSTLNLSNSEILEIGTWGGEAYGGGNL